MRKTSIRRSLCIAMATLTAIGFTACGSTNAARNEARVEHASETTYENTVTEDTVTGGASTTDPAAESFTRAYEDSAADKYPDADFIEKIDNGTFIIIERDRQTKTINVTIYNIVKDEVINEFTVDSGGESLLTPEIFEGRGFGFIIPGTYQQPGAIAYYYDTEGNLVSTFEKRFETRLNDSYMLAPDGSALYAVVNDREQCACGYDFKADYTTQIYKIYADGTDEVIGDYDSHYDLYPLGVTDEGKIVFAYHYDEHDKVVKTHEEYEKLEFVSIEELEKLQGGGEKEDDGKIVESGYVLMDAADDSAHELEKICLTNTYCEHYFVRGNNIILTNDDEILRLAPDQNGQYKETHYETPVGIKGYYTSLYVSSSGDYVVFPQYTEDCKDTTVNVLHFSGDKADLIFSEYYEGWNIEIKAVYRITYFDEETGDFYGYYDETAEGGTRNLRYEANAYGE